MLPSCSLSEFSVSVFWQQVDSLLAVVVHLLLHFLHHLLLLVRVGHHEQFDFVFRAPTLVLLSLSSDTYSIYERASRTKDILDCRNRSLVLIMLLLKRFSYWLFACFVCDLTCVEIWDVLLTAVLRGERLVWGHSYQAVSFPQRAYRFY